MSESVLIVGAGPGLSTSLARLCASKGMKVVLASRMIEKLNELKKEINAETIKCDSSNEESVSNLFKEVDKLIGTPNLVIYNASSRPKRESVVDLRFSKFICFCNGQIWLKRIGTIPCKRTPSKRYSYSAFYY